MLWKIGQECMKCEFFLHQHHIKHVWDQIYYFCELKVMQLDFYNDEQIKEPNKELDFWKNWQFPYVAAMVFGVKRDGWLARVNYRRQI